MSLFHVESTKRVSPYEKIRKRSEYLEVQSIGRRFGQPRLLIMYTPSNCGQGTGKNKFGITVSRRVGNAVVRNRVKRRIREVIRHHSASLCGSWKIVVIARTRASNASFHSLEKDFLGFTHWLSERAA